VFELLEVSEIAALEVDKRPLELWGSMVASEGFAEMGVFLPRVVGMMEKDLEENGREAVLGGQE
jgi:hypothetical protein